MTSARPTVASDLPTLRPGALVTPDNRGPDWPVVAVDQGGAVHLAGEADADDSCPGGGRRGGGPKRVERRVFPVLGVLLGPAGPRRVQRVGELAAVQDRPVIIDQHAPGAGSCRRRSRGADVCSYVATATDRCGLRGDRLHVFEAHARIGIQEREGELHARGAQRHGTARPDRHARQ